jgi:hypothetical protein
MNCIKFGPRVDGDFFPSDLSQLLREAPRKPTIIGFADTEAGFFSECREAVSFNPIDCSGSQTSDDH